MFVLRSTYFQTHCHVYAQIYMLLGSLPCLRLIYMPMCSLSCLRLDLHAYVFFAMFVLTSICFQAPWHVYAQMYMPMSSLPCLCLDLHAFVLFALSTLRSISLSDLCLVHVYRSTCWLLCHELLRPFYLLISLFPMFWPLLVGGRSRSCGLGLHPYTQACI